MMLKIHPHIVPEDDTRKHWTTHNARCWCRPLIENGHIVHRSQDEIQGFWRKAQKMARDGYGHEDIRIHCRITAQQAWDLVMKGEGHDAPL